MPLDQNRYRNLEQRFRHQVERDNAKIGDRGIYLPCLQPEEQVDYIFVGMEPSFYSWAESIEDAERKIACGFTNFWGFDRPPSKLLPDRPTEPLRLFVDSIARFLCQPGESYHLTDLAKGAMPVKVAGRQRSHRYKEWLPLLLDEIAIAGKPHAPVIAIGKKVWDVLQRHGLNGEPQRRCYHVLHYSESANAYRKREADGDPKSFKTFRTQELRSGRYWPVGLRLSLEQLVFTYKKQFEVISADQ